MSNADCGASSTGAGAGATRSIPSIWACSPGFNSGATAGSGVATGAAVAGVKGEDVLSGALMGGLGGYGGGNLGSSFGKMGAQGGYQAGQTVGPQLTAEGGLSSAGSGQGMMSTLAASNSNIPPLAKAIGPPAA